METLLKTRGWFWAVNSEKYNKISVTEMPSFCGWNVLLDLIAECEYTEYYAKSQFLNKVSIAERKRLQKLFIKRDRGLIATSFTAGGRVLEITMLKKSMFTIKSDRLVIEGMSVVKRFKKIREVVVKWEGKGDPDPELKYHFLPQFGGWVKRKYVTKPIMDTRNIIEVPISEKLVPFVTEWLDEVESGDYLFPQYCKSGNLAISPTRCYQILRDLGERCGLHKYINGVVVNQHITPHWFRSQRASQLAEEYGFREFELKRFFSWKSDQMAAKYAKLSPTKLFQLMKAIE